ncbi:FAD binding domain protein [Hypoxylon sp. NC1633]|nr:FAD binding domain protein [Hypoxylon sp. NC1633]
MSNKEPPFRVIVVGGGIAGLAASHCLQRAGIDHIVLEKHREAVPTEGASITIYPQVVRILQQLGCADRLIKTSVPHEYLVARRPDGSELSRTKFFGYVKENHGADLLPLERREFLQLLYDGLPDKTPIRNSIIIKDVKEVIDGVEVTLADGTVEKGDMLLGCDGVHSSMRSFMWHYANKDIPGFITDKEKNAFKTQWKCLVGVGPPEASLGASDLTVTHDDKYSFEIVAQPDRTFFFVYFYLKEPYSSPARVRYTDQDAEELAATVADHPLTPTCKFGDLWKNRVRGTLVASEEGILEHWHHGRIVLAGDAVHKMTPNIALGGNAAIESIVTLCNHLHRLLQKQQGAKPSRAALREVFAAYQAERWPRITYAIKISGIATRIQAWTTPLYKLAAFATPWLPERGAPDQLGQYIRGSPKLEYGAASSSTSFAERLPVGAMAWKDEEDLGQGQGVGMGKTVLAVKGPAKGGKMAGAGFFYQVMSLGFAVVMLVSAVRFLPLGADVRTQQLISWVRF